MQSGRSATELDAQTEILVIMQLCNQTKNGHRKTRQALWCSCDSVLCSPARQSTLVHSTPHSHAFSVTEAHRTALQFQLCFCAHKQNFWGWCLKHLEQLEVRPLWQLGLRSCLQMILLFFCLEQLKLLFVFDRKKLPRCHFSFVGCLICLRVAPVFAAAHECCTDSLFCLLAWKLQA